MQVVLRPAGAAARLCALLSRCGGGPLAVGLLLCRLLLRPLGRDARLDLARLSLVKEHVAAALARLLGCGGADWRAWRQVGQARLELADGHRRRAQHGEDLAGRLDQHGRQEVGAHVDHLEQGAHCHQAPRVVLGKLPRRDVGYVSVGGGKQWGKRGRTRIGWRCGARDNPSSSVPATACVRLPTCLRRRVL
eukprot:scaffold11431_cov118-Isochrysis_galbana.AAC.6